MKQYLTPDQTAKLIELGFEKPKSIEVYRDGHYVPFVEQQLAYSIGELIEVIPDTGSDNWRDRQIFGTTVYYYAEKSIYVCDENGELIDNLFDMVVLLKEGGSDMIHEEICTYEVCKLAKEKGFNVQTFDWYDYAGNYNKGFIPHKLHECPRYKEYYAPSQSLLQRWLREEKNIHISINYQQGVDEDCPSYDYSVYRWAINTEYFVSEEWKDGYFTYELALEDALKYALENLVI